jgi:hypothetical protein
VLAVERVTYIYSQIDCPSIVELVRMLGVGGVTDIY